MDNQIQPTGTEQAGQPVTAPVQGEYLTRQEAEKLANDAAETAFRRAQGLITARDNKIQEKVKELEGFIALQKQHGIEVTDADAAKLKQAVITSAATDLPSTLALPTTPAQGVPGNEATQASAYFTTLAIGYERKIGVALDDSDPEAKQVLVDAADPTDYLDSYRAALEAKKLRLQSPTPQLTVNARTPTNLGGVGGAAPAVRVISVESARSALAKGLSK